MSVTVFDATHRVIRGVVGVALCALALVRCSSTAEPSADVVANATLSLDGATDHQVGYVATALPRALRARVMNGSTPVRGARVVWSTTFGVIRPAESVTDAQGMAESVWTFGEETDAAANSPSAAATLADAPGNTVTFTAQLVKGVAIALLPGSNDQIATVGTSLPNPLRARVTSLGVPLPGVGVRWSGVRLGGDVTTLTDASGIATFNWTLPTVASNYVVNVTTEANPRVTTRLVATAVADVVDSLGVFSGDNQSLPVNQAAFQPLQVLAYDRYRNPADNAAVEWHVLTGPGELRRYDAKTNGTGVSSATVVPIGVTGRITVAAQANGKTAVFRISARTPEWRITLSTNDYVFVSTQNNTRPAVDTLPVGGTAVFTLDPFDYDLHGVEFFNSPATPGGGLFPYANPSTVIAVFTTPGVYHYRDPYYLMEGTIVVR